MELCVGKGHSVSRSLRAVHCRRHLPSEGATTSIPLVELVLFTDAALMPLSLRQGPAPAAPPLRLAPRDSALAAPSPQRTATERGDFGRRLLSPAHAQSAPPPWEAVGGFALRFSPLLVGVVWNVREPRSGHRFFLRIGNAV